METSIMHIANAKRPKISGAKTLLLVSVVALGTVFQSCEHADLIVSSSELKVPTLEEALGSNDQRLINLLHKVRGSVGRRGPASKTIWSRKNDYGLGLYISANHVYGLTGWSSRNAQFFDLYSENLGIFETSQMPPVNGNIALGRTLIADFPFMHFDISASASNTTLLPEEDFYLGIIDNQRIEQGPLSKHPDVVQTVAPLQMYDRDSRTTAVRTWNTPVAGQQAVAVGYPQDRASYPNGAVAYGQILSDSETVNIILKLKAAGDAEGNIPYNSNVEFFVDARAITGMSGGGVFNSEGQLLGIMVRASDQKNAPKIIRVVKTSYIQARMVEFYNGLLEASKNKVAPFIRGELLNGSGIREER